MKPKNKPNLNLWKELDRTESHFGDPIDERWWIEEYYPAHENNDGVYFQDSRISKSEPFKTEAEAQKFMDEQQPDQPFYKLRLRSEKLYEYTERRWM